MDRKFLEDKGLEKDVIDEIMKEHGKAVQAVKPDDDYEALVSEKENLEKKITDLNSTLTATNEKYADYEENVTKLTDTVNQYKTKDLKTRIANEHGIPFELAGRLSGETEEEIKADAESLSSFVSKKQPPLPLGSTEPTEVEEKKYSNQARILEEQYKSE